METGMSRTDTSTRTIATSKASVYAALIDPDAMVQWLPPAGMSAKFDHFDARPGGGYRMVLTYVDAAGSPGKTTPDADIVEVRFLELVSGEKIVQAVDFESDDPAFAGTMTMTWTLVQVESGTRVNIRADDVPAGISAEDHAEGLASSLANLDTWLTGGS